MVDYSILQAVYCSDNPEYLSQSIESMLAQTHLSNDYVIVEDGPIPDELESVIAVYKQKYSFITVVRLPFNVGLGLALNAGLSQCKNELIARMDSDDISLPDRCAKQVACFEEDPELDIVGCPVSEFQDSVDNIVGQRAVPLDNETIHVFVRRRDPFNHPTVMYRKSKVLQYGPYGDYRKNQDTDLWIKLLSKGCKGKNINEPLLLFRFDQETLRKRRSWANTRNLIAIRWDAMKKGLCSFWDFCVVSATQLLVFVMPPAFQEVVYKFIRH